MERFGPFLQLPVAEDGCSVSDLSRLLLERFPEVGQDALKGVRSAVADEIVTDDHHVAAGEEVEFFPLFSGG